MPPISIFSTNPRKFLVNNTFDPPPKTSFLTVLNLEVSVEFLQLFRLCESTALKVGPDSQTKGIMVLQ